MKRKREADDPTPEESSIARNVHPPDHRILVVDDDDSVREMLVRVLVGEGYQVWAAASGRAAMEVVSAAKFDLVLLDLNLPGENGWEIFEALTAHDPLLTVIIVTARSNQLFTALGAGVGALLEKPLNFAKLLQTMSQLLAEGPEARRTRHEGSRTDFHYIHGQSPDPTFKTFKKKH